MQYTSTRDRSHTFSASQAIAKGLAEDGGLLTPAYLPKLPGKALNELKEYMAAHNIEKVTELSGAVRV